MLLPRAQAAASRVEKVQRGCIDDAEHGSIAGHEGYVHGELAVPMEKLLRAVERIDKPEPIPSRAFLIGRNLPFFRNHRDGAVPFQQSVNDDAMGTPIGFCQRTSIVFEGHHSGAFIVRQNRCAGRARDLTKPVERLGRDADFSGARHHYSPACALQDSN